MNAWWQCYQSQICLAPCKDPSVACRARHLAPIPCATHPTLMPSCSGVTFTTPCASADAMAPAAASTPRQRAAGVRKQCADVRERETQSLAASKPAALQTTASFLLLLLPWVVHTMWYIGIQLERSFNTLLMRMLTIVWYCQGIKCCLQPDRSCCRSNVT